MTDAERDDLVRLIVALSRDGGAVPNMPRDVFHVIGRLVPLIAVEIGIVHSCKRELLLTWRDDDLWYGWHIPGGYVGVHETVREACERIAQRELGIGVKFTALLDSYSWTDHPLGSVVSLVCRCSTHSAPQEGKWFDSPPTPMAPHHTDFFHQLLEASLK